jgi:uncharacterized membrane protein
MRMYRYHEGWDHGGPHLLGWLIPLIVVAGLAVLAVWAVRRLTATPLPPALPRSGAVPQTDLALESARLRYAKGEISREDYLGIASDLGAPIPDHPAPSPSAGGPDA